MPLMVTTRIAFLYPEDDPSFPRSTYRQLHDIFVSNQFSQSSLNHLPANLRQRLFDHIVNAGGQPDDIHSLNMMNAVAEVAMEIFNNFNQPLRVEIQHQVGIEIHARQMGLSRNYLFTPEEANISLLLGAMDRIADMLQIVDAAQPELPPSLSAPPAA